MDKSPIDDAIRNAFLAITKMQDAYKMGYCSVFKERIGSAEENLQSAINSLKRLKRGHNG